MYIKDFKLFLVLIPEIKEGIYICFIIYFRTPNNAFDDVILVNGKFWLVQYSPI